MEIFKNMKPPWYYLDFLRFAIMKGYTVATTSAAHLKDHPDIMEFAEQRGLLWVLSKDQPRRRYSSHIAVNMARRVPSW